MQPPVKRDSLLKISSEINSERNGYCRSSPFNPYAAGGLKSQYKIMQKKQMGTHLRVLSESYLMSTNMAGFRWFSKIFASLCIG